MTAVASPTVDEPRVVPALAILHARPIDEERATAAATSLLEALGLDLTNQSLARTPHRMVRAFAELLTSEPVRLTTFPNDAGYDELVLVSDISFTSLCEHHLLPFGGVAHVGYLPGERIIGLSKLARIVGAFAGRPQVQERLTAQIAQWLGDQLTPRGVGVVIEAHHSCMSIRGVRAAGSRTVTSALHGSLRSDPAARQEFLQLSGAASAKGST